MGVHREHHLESVSRIEVLAGPTGKRRWSDAMKGRIIAVSLVSGVSVRSVAERYGLLRLKFQVQHPQPAGHRMLRWTDEASTSAARNVA